MVAVARREAPVGDVRYEGDLVPELGFAGLLTGRGGLLPPAKAQAPPPPRPAGPFSDKPSPALPADGSSLEGYAYAGYGGEHLLLYTLLGRELLGRDDTNNPWVRHFAENLLHGLLPRRTAEEWAMTFGDAPRRARGSTPPP